MNNETHSLAGPRSYKKLIFRLFIVGGVLLVWQFSRLTQFYSRTQKFAESRKSGSHRQMNRVMGDNADGIAFVWSLWLDASEVLC